jgi:hypothetical protein
MEHLATAVAALGVTGTLNALAAIEHAKPRKIVEHTSRKNWRCIFPQYWLMPTPWQAPRHKLITNRRTEEERRRYEQYLQS